MNVVDSSAWLEYFADGPNAQFFAPAILKKAELIVCVISVFEVFKRVLQQRGENAALQAASLLQDGRVVEITTPLALTAARLSQTLKLPMADSLILATAKAFDALLWTQDADFEGMSNIKYRSARR